MDQLPTIPADQTPIPPTSDEPIPFLAGTLGLKLLRQTTPHGIAHLAPEEIQTVRETLPLVLGSLTPPTTAQIATVIERLAMHYPQLKRTPDEQKIWVRDWIEDLSEWPIDLVHEAARMWRNSEADRFPTPGQLMGPLKPVMAHREALGRRAKLLMAVEEA